MTDNQFDHFFREKLKDHSAPVPDGLWDKIRAEKERKPMGFYLSKKTGKGLFVAAILAGASLVAYEMNQYNPQIKETTNNIHSNSSNQLSTLSDNTSTQKISTDKNNSVQQNTIYQIVYDSNSIQQLPLINTSTSQAFLKPSNIEYATESNPSLMNDENASLSNYTASNHGTGYPISISTNSSNQQLSMVNKQLAANAHVSKIKSIIICPTIRGKSSSFNSEWGLEVFASPDYAFKSVSPNTAPQQYIDKKDSSEQMQLGFSAGFRLVKPLNDHILLKTGFQYSQINEKFTYRNENEIKTTTVITLRTIIRSPGDTIQVSDTSVLQQIGYSVKNNQNHYRSIDIPLTVGYQFGNGDWNFAINGGVIFNIASWYQGEVLDSSYAPVSISKSNNSSYKTNIGMGLYSSISVMKKINENTHLFFEPYFRYNLQNVTTEQSPYHQRFHIGGLAIGLKFNLNR